MNFQFDLKTTYRKGLDMVPVYFEHLKTVAYFATAFVYVAGKRTGEYYFANQEEIHLHLALFAEAVTIGTRRAFDGTIQLGADARVVANEIPSALDAAWARHHATFSVVQRALYAYAAR